MSERPNLAAAILEVIELDDRGEFDSVESMTEWVLNRLGVPAPTSSEEER